MFSANYRNYKINLLSYKIMQFSCKISANLSTQKMSIKIKEIKMQRIKKTLCNFLYLFYFSFSLLCVVFWINEIFMFYTFYFTFFSPLKQLFFITLLFSVPCFVPFVLCFSLFCFIIFLYIVHLLCLWGKQLYSVYLSMKKNERISVIAFFTTFLC